MSSNPERDNTAKIYRRVSFVSAFQFTQDMLERHLFDKELLPESLTVLRSNTMPPQRRIYSADVRGRGASGEFDVVVNVGDWVLTHYIWIDGWQAQVGVQAMRDEWFRPTYQEVTEYDPFGPEHLLPPRLPSRPMTDAEIDRELDEQAIREHQEMKHGN